MSFQKGTNNGFIKVKPLTKGLMLVRFIESTDIPKKKEFDTHYLLIEGSPDEGRKP